MASRDGMLPRGGGASAASHATQPPREGLGVGEVDEKEVGAADGLQEQVRVEHAGRLGASRAPPRPAARRAQRAGRRPSCAGPLPGAPPSSRRPSPRASGGSAGRKPARPTPPTARRLRRGPRAQAGSSPRRGTLSATSCHAIVIPRDSRGTGPEESAGIADPSSPDSSGAPRGDKTRTPSKNGAKGPAAGVHAARLLGDRRQDVERRLGASVFLGQHRDGEALPALEARPVHEHAGPQQWRQGVARVEALPRPLRRERRRSIDDAQRSGGRRIPRRPA